MSPLSNNLSSTTNATSSNKPNQNLVGQEVDSKFYDANNKNSFDQASRDNNSRHAPARALNASTGMNLYGVSGNPAELAGNIGQLSRTGNELNPRSNYDRTTGTSASDRYHQDQGHSTDHHSAGLRGVGVSPAETESHNPAESHNLTSSDYDAQPVGPSDMQDHRVGAQGGVSHNNSGRSARNEHAHSTQGIHSDSTDLSSAPRSLRNEHPNANHSVNGSFDGPHHTSMTVSSHSEELAAPLGPEVSEAHHARSDVHINEFVSGRTDGSSHHIEQHQHSLTSGVESGLPGAENANDSDSLTGKNHAFTIGGGGDFGAGNTHAGTGRDLCASDKNVHTGRDGITGTENQGEHHHHSNQAGVAGVGARNNAHDSNSRHNSSSLGETHEERKLQALDRTGSGVEGVSGDRHTFSSTSSSATPGSHSTSHSNIDAKTPLSSTSDSKAHQANSSIAADHKPSLMEKVKGTVEAIVGKTTSNPGKVAEGTALKTGHAATSSTH